MRELYLDLAVVFDTVAAFVVSVYSKDYMVLYLETKKCWYTNSRLENKGGMKWQFRMLIVNYYLSS